MGDLADLNVQVPLTKICFKTKRPFQYTQAMPEDDHVVEPPAGHLDLAGIPITLRHGTLGALREFKLHVDSTLNDDYDRCEEFLKGLPSGHLVIFETDPKTACDDFPMNPGRLSLNTVAQAAKLIRERRDRYWTMGLTALGSLIVAIIAAWTTAKMTITGMM